MPKFRDPEEAGRLAGGKDEVDEGLVYLVYLDQNRYSGASKQIRKEHDV